jgi:hypothetical protein
MNNISESFFLNFWSEASSVLSLSLTYPLRSCVHKKKLWFSLIPLHISLFLIQLLFYIPFLQALTRVYCFIVLSPITNQYKTDDSQTFLLLAKT